MYGVLKCVDGSVPRMVPSVTQSKARSLPLAVLVQRAFPYTKSQTDLFPVVLPPANIRSASRARLVINQWRANARAPY